MADHLTKRALWALVAGALVVLVAFVAVSYLDNRTRAVADGQRALAARAQLVAASVDRVLAWRTMEMLTFVALPSLRGFAASDETARPARTAIALSEIQAIVAADPSIRSMAITNQAGYVILATDASMNSDWSNRVFVHEALVGHLYGSPATRELGEVSQYYSAPLINNAGNVAGALVARIAVQEMWNVLADQRNVWIFDENLVRIADSSDRPALLSSLSPMSGNVLSDLMSEELYGAEVTQIRSENMTELAKAIQRREQQVVVRDASGKTVYAAIRRLTNNPWAVVAFETEDEMLAPAVAGLVDYLKIGVLAALLSSALTYAYLRRVGLPGRRT